MRPDVLAGKSPVRDNGTAIKFIFSKRSGSRNEDLPWPNEVSLWLPHRVQPDDPACWLGGEHVTLRN